MKRLICFIVAALLEIQFIQAFDLVGSSYVGDVSQGYVEFVDGEKLRLYTQIDGKYGEIVSRYEIKKTDQVPYLLWGNALENKFLILFSRQECYLFNSEDGIVLIGVNYGGKKKPPVGARAIAEEGLILKAYEYLATPHSKKTAGTTHRRISETFGQEIRGLRESKDQASVRN